LPLKPEAGPQSGMEPGNCPPPKLLKTCLFVRYNSKVR